MGGGSLPIYPQLSVARADTNLGEVKGFMLVFFVLLALQLILPGLDQMKIAGASVVARMTQIVFFILAATYVCGHAMFYLSVLPGLVCVAMFLTASFFATELFTNQNLSYAIFESAKVLAPYLAFMVMLKFAKEQPQAFTRAAKAILAGCYLLSLIGLAVLPRNPMQGRAFAPAYFGGGMHTSAYIICLCGVCIHILYLRGILPRWLSRMLLIVTILLIAVIWNVRTTVVLFLVFFAVLYWNQSRRFVIPLIVLLLAGALLYSFLHGTRFSVDALVTFSSGRISMWAYKLELLAQVDMLQLLFGKGVGSDLTRSDIWWWAAKDSHNDYLHVFTELGVVGLGLVLLAVGMLRIAAGPGNRAATALVVGYLAASGLSNGLMSRPVPALIFALAMVATVLPRQTLMPVCFGERRESIT